MVKQYVGARYVPKFASPVEWAADTSYEALTIVTFNNASYTSKIPVPPTVGNPANNPKYWALTGNYNAQVEQYRQETGNYNAQVEQYRQETGNYNAQVEEYRSETEQLKTDVQNNTPFVTGAMYNVINDGNSDTTATLQAAIDDSSKNCKALVLKGGVYKIDGQLTLYRNTRIKGEGYVLFDFSGHVHNDFCIHLLDNYIDGTEYLSLTQDVVYPYTLDNVAITGNNGVQHSSPDNLQYCKSVCFLFETHEKIFNNVTCTHFNTVFTYADNCYINTSINSTFSWNKEVIHFDLDGHTNSGERMTFINCLFGNNGKVLYNHLGYFIFNTCSIDYNSVIAESGEYTADGTLSAMETYIGCHIEWGTGNTNYKFTDISSVGSYRIFDDCIFIIGNLPFILHNSPNDRVQISNSLMWSYLIKTNDYIVDTKWITYKFINCTARTPTSAYADIFYGKYNTITKQIPLLVKSVQDGTAINNKDNTFSLTTNGPYKNPTTSITVNIPDGASVVDVITSCDKTNVDFLGLTLKDGAGNMVYTIKGGYGSSTHRIAVSLNDPANEKATTATVSFYGLLTSDSNDVKTTFSNMNINII